MLVIANFVELLFHALRLPRTPVNTGGSKGDEDSRPSVRLHTFADQFVGFVGA